MQPRPSLQKINLGGFTICLSEVRGFFPRCTCPAHIPALGVPVAWGAPSVCAVSSEPGVLSGSGRMGDAVPPFLSCVAFPNWLGWTDPAFPGPVWPFREDWPTVDAEAEAEAGSDPEPGLWWGGVGPLASDLDACPLLLGWSPPHTHLMLSAACTRACRPGLGRPGARCRCFPWGTSAAPRGLARRETGRKNRTVWVNECACCDTWAQVTFEPVQKAQPRPGGRSLQIALFPNRWPQLPSCRTGQRMHQEWPLGPAQLLSGLCGCKAVGGCLPPDPCYRLNQVAPVREGWRSGRRHSGWYQVFPEILGCIFRLAGP